MKVVHLSTYDSGGAAIAALRLHQGLLREGIDSSFLSLHASNPDNDPSRFKYPRRRATMPERIGRKLGLEATRQERNERMTRHLTGSYEAFTFPLTDHRVEAHPLVKNADIVHLHWVADFINYPSFFQSVSRPIVWTMHDMNPMMGGFHYTGDKERNPAWADIEEELRKIKVSALKDVKNLSISTPSQWLGGHVAAYSPLAKFDRVCIPYGLDINIFKPHNKEFSRRVFNISPSRKVILFVSEKVENYRKGFDILREALKESDFDDDLQVISIGIPFTNQAQDGQVFSLGTIRDDRLLALLFSAADLFILPSREDNFPNVMLESLACGTPVLSFSNGGMREVVRPGFNGILMEEISAKSLGLGIAQFLNGDFSIDSTAIREYMVKNYDLSVQANRYMDLYRHMINRSGV